MHNIVVLIYQIINYAPHLQIHLFDSPMANLKESEFTGNMTLKF